MCICCWEQKVTCGLNETDAPSLHQGSKNVALRLCSMHFDVNAIDYCWNVCFH